MSSPKTTLAAIAMLVTAIAMVLTGVSSGDLGSVEWGVVIALVSGAFGFFFARDNNVSSEAVEKKNVKVVR